jgi:hypothetical protein
MTALLHFGFNFENRPYKIAELKAIFDEADDWVRYAPNCWIVRTNLQAEYWYNRIKPVLHPEDQVFIAKIDHSNRFGFLSKWMWDRLTA